MQAVGRGDPHAFEEIVRRHQHTAWKTAYRFLGEHHEAEDVVQEAFLKILDAAPRYRPTASFRTYLYYVVSRLCFDRSKKRRPHYTDEPPDVADPGPNFAELALGRERHLAVRGALDALPPNQRMAMVLRYYEELGYAEIAQALATTEKAVERLLARGREGLRGLLAEWK
jgi:RNA polymerase sigma-70 factor (ECF subfamily)